MTLRAGDRLGPYEIEGVLGAGGMGQVLRARDPRLERAVAVKVVLPGAALDADRLRRFEQEARACGSLSHPNIVAVYDVGSRDGRPYLVSELLEGETLRQRLAGGGLPVHKAVDVAIQVARGLAAAHERGIVHRDLKPENVFVTKEGVVKILDFGLARLVPPADEPASDSGGNASTGSGVVMGTAGYMSPEQARGQAVDHRSDVFAFGALLYEMLAGRRAFQGISSVETLHAILYDEPPELPAAASIPAWLERVVRHCLEKKPEDRYQSARDLAFDLSADAATPATSGRTAAAPGEAGTRRRWRPPAAAVIALVAALGGFVAGRGASPAPKIPSFRPITFRRGLTTSGRFTADGRTIVYAATFEDATEPEVFSVRTEAPDSRDLGFSGQIVGVSSKDELAILKGSLVYPGAGTLARVPMAGGQPRPLAENVTCADLAPDGENLAAMRIVNGLTQVEFPLGTTLARQKPGEDAFGCPRFSPRGDRLAVGVSKRGYRIFDTATGRSFDVSGVADPAHEYWFAWSPDGDEIWFTANPEDERPLEAVTLSGRRRVLARIAGNMSLYDVSREGVALFEHAFARERVVARAPGETYERDLSIFDSSWLSDLSADGRFVLVTERGAATAHRNVTYLRRTDGSPPMRLTEDGMGVCLSPDARWALVRPALVGVPSKWSGLRVVPTGPGEERAIATPAGLTFGPGTWVSEDRVVIAGHQADWRWHEYLLDVKTGALRQFTAGETGACAPGPRSVACVVDAPRRVELFPYAGGFSRTLPGFEATLVPRRLSDDEKSVFVLASSPGASSAAPFRVERLDLAAQRRELLHQVRPADTTGVVMWHVYVTADGRGYAYNYQQVLHTLYVAHGVR